MTWAGWAAIAVTLLMSLINLVRSLSEDRGVNREWRKMVEDTLKRHESEHGRHRVHVIDTEAHWTPRQRDDLTAQLNRIEELIIESMTPRARRNNGHLTED